MKAVYWGAYGDPSVLEIREVDKPQIGPHDVCVQVVASTVNSGDVRLRGLDAGDGLRGYVLSLVMRLLVGVRSPRRKVPGNVFCGRVTEVGSEVSAFAVGENVYGQTGLQLGTHAEYCVVPENGAIAHMPETASFAEAAALPFGGTTALYFLKKAGLAPDKKVLIYGSTGAVGTAAVQVASIAGAEVHAVCSPNGDDLTRSLGAVKVFNYKDENWQQDADVYDIVFDAVGKSSKKQLSSLMKEGGVFATVGGNDVAKEVGESLIELARLFDEKGYKSVIDKTFPLEEIVAAHTYVEAGTKKGNVVLTIAS